MAAKKKRGDQLRMMQSTRTPAAKPRLGAKKQVAKKPTKRKSKRAKKKAAEEPANGCPVQVQVGPVGRNSKRLVIATWPTGEHRDTMDTNDATQRTQFRRATENKREEESDLSYLDTLIVREADKADELAKESLPEDATGGRSIAQSAVLVSIADDAELFCDFDGEAYATFAVKEHFETWPLRSKVFKEWLACKYYRDSGRVPGNQAMQDAMATLAAKARFDGRERRVHVRVAEYNNAIYLDLGDADWRVAKIEADGVKILTRYPVKFRRSKSMQPLPIPELNGSINELRPFLNAQDEDEWVLSVGTIVGMLNPKGPYAVDVAFGEKGTAKSTRTRVIRALVDPQVAAIRSEPRSIQDLMIAANSSWIVAYDNLSFVQNALSDALCRLSTGGGFGTRMLFTNDEEAIFDLQRPVMLNGIEELATRGDLLDRAIVHQLKVIPPARRIPENEFWVRFNQAKPRILGALLTAVSAALRNLPNTSLDNPPRMADFALWVTAAEQALGWKKYTFIKAYRRNIREAHLVSLEVSPLVSPLCRFMEEMVREGQSRWEGTATCLLRYMESRVDKTILDRNTWPRSPQSLSNKLRRLAPNLRIIQMEVEFLRATTRNRTRTIRIRVPEDFERPANPSSPGPGEVPRG